ncbi:MAG: hypothetical protein AAGE01_18775 [Pseudomonadota bacterium]
MRNAPSMLRSFLALLLAVGLSTVQAAEDGEVDYIDLAAVLVQDGYYDRAEQALLNIEDPEAEEIDTARYWSVFGLVHLNRNALELAGRDFYAAIDAGLVDEVTGQTPEVIYIYLAQVHFGLEEYDQAIESLDRAGSTAARLSSTWTLRSHAHWLLGQQQETFDTLAEASSRFPDNHTFLRRKVFYLIELRLFQQAGDLGGEYLALTEGTADDHVAIGNALRQAGSFDDALRFLETGALRYPDDINVQKVLGHTHFEAGRPLAAADIFYRASMQDPELVSEAAELYRRAGLLYRSLMLNGEIVDQEKKLKQRLAIFLGLERFEAITAMEDAMYRVGLLEDEDLRYAMGYAWFKVGNYAKAEEHIARLQRPDLFRKGIELREIMEDCKGAAWRCS